MTASDCAAKASFSSIQSRSSCFRPALRSAAGMASIGPMPMMCGGTPRLAKLTKRASGCRPKRFTAASLARISAPAPSEVCELLPAVTEPRAANTVLSLARPSTVVSGRAPSSRLTVRVVTATSAASRSTARSVTSTGVISSLNSPAFMAAMRLHVRAVRKFVLRLAADLPLLRHLLRRQAHAVGDAVAFDVVGVA